MVPKLEPATRYLQKQVQDGKDEYLPALVHLQRSVERIDALFRCLDYAWGLNLYRSRVLLDGSSTLTPTTPQDVLNITSPTAKPALLESILQEKRSDILLT